MTSYAFDMKKVDPSWKDCIAQGLQKVDSNYLNKLSQTHNWLPGPEKIFNAFSLPVNKVNYVLFGESPYPRRESANGYAFWDAAVNQLWSSTGLSKPVNRATSLRNILKMLLLAEGLLKKKNLSQAAITKIDKHSLVQTNGELFTNFTQHGFLLLNATLVLHTDSRLKDARIWQPFVKQLLKCLLEEHPKIQFIFLGRIAHTIDKLIDWPQRKKIYAEHPFNLSFITNQTILDFFRPLHLLKLK